jgi:hypothetical protein
VSGSLYLDKQFNGITEALRLGDLDELTQPQQDVYSLMLLLSESTAMPLFTEHGGEVVGTIFDYLINLGTIDCVSGSQFSEFVRGGYFWSLRTSSL